MTKTSINLLTRIVSSSVSLYGQVIFVAQTHKHTHARAREHARTRAYIWYSWIDFASGYET